MTLFYMHYKGFSLLIPSMYLVRCQKLSPLCAQMSHFLQFIKLSPLYVQMSQSVQFIKLSPLCAQLSHFVQFIKLFPLCVQMYHSVQFIKLSPLCAQMSHSVQFIKLCSNDIYQCPYMVLFDDVILYDSNLWCFTIKVKLLIIQLAGKRFILLLKNF